MSHNFQLGILEGRREDGGSGAGRMVGERERRQTKRGRRETKTEPTRGWRGARQRREGGNIVEGLAVTTNGKTYETTETSVNSSIARIVRETLFKRTTC